MRKSGGDCGESCLARWRTAVRNYVLDTHTLLWSLIAPARIRRAARRALDDIDNGRARGWIPAAVGAEMILLFELGRTEIGMPQLKAAVEESTHLAFLPLDVPQLDEFAALGAIRDPFDRLIIAAARHLDAHLISKDQGLADSGLVHVVWD